MTAHIPTRDEAFNILCHYTENESLVNHALAVESVMRYMAQKLGGNEEQWGIIGLIHDLDWEKYPDQHCTMTEKILREAEWPEEYIRAVISHGWGLFNDIEPQTELEKVLYAVDELTGLVAATALVRPSRSILDMKAKSVRKKWNQKAFAAGVDRSIIEKGAQRLGVELNDLITDVIEGMKPVASDIGLAGMIESEN